jgi:uroporphyrinogen-III decarboxylase
MNTVSNEEKKQVWQSYYDRKPIRVPLRWNVNSRVILLNPQLNPEGIGYREYFNNPQTMLKIQARLTEYVVAEFSKVSDGSSELPESWNFGVENQNIYDAAYFGAKILFEPGQVPSTHQFMDIDDVDWFLAQDFSNPLEQPWIKERLEFREKMADAANDFTYLGRQGKVGPFGVGFDGPLTIAANLFGSDIFTLLGEDPDKTVEVLMHITKACILRNHALSKLAGNPTVGEWGWLADDSIQLISSGMYEEFILPIHEFAYSNFSTTKAEDKKRSIHLCGDSTRHFKLIHDKLGVMSFDTGFPVNHGKLRDELGEEVEISGGPRVDLLMQGTEEECYEEAKKILTSGIKRGGRFILQEGNNLPPCVPSENLAAVYQACKEFGKY